MTWFLQNRTAAPAPAAPAVDGPAPSWGQQAFGAAYEGWATRGKASWVSPSIYAHELAVEMEEALGGNPLKWDLKRGERIEYDDPMRRGYISARRIGELRAVDTESRFKDFPTTPEEFDAEVNRRRDRDIAENRTMLARGDSTSARVVGSLGGAIADPIGLFTLPFGGPTGSAIKYIGTQAALGAATELPGAIAGREDAIRRGETPQDPLTAVGTAAAGSAILGGAIYGAGRLVGYVGETRKAAKAQRPEGVAGVDYEDAIDGATRDLRLGRDPAPLAPSRPNPTLRAEDDPAVQNIARFIGQIEANGNWDIVYSGSVIRPPRPLTKMTVDEVLAWQARSVAAGSDSSAAGGFQILRDTLSGLKKEMRLSGSEIFDANLQMKMGVQLMKRRGLEEWRAGRISTDAFIDNMAEEWAALPRATGANAGRSHYAGDGLNSARASLDQTRSVFGGEAFPGDFQGGTPNGGFDVAGGPSMPIRGPGFFDQVTTPAGTTVPVEYRVVDLSELRAASGDLQPRDRSRVSSDEQIAEIAARLDPRRLMPTRESDRGAPIVGPDGIVESGNGRVAALRRAAAEHPDRYQAYVEEIRGTGIEIPDGVTQPVLVARRQGDLDLDSRRAFVRESNSSAIARMSATEQARTNADYLTQRAFDAFRPGERLGGPGNTEFLRRFFAAMPQAERAPFIGQDGRLTIDGLRIVRQSLFHRAFPADDLLRLLAETENPALSNLLRMMEDIAPDWAAFRAMVEAGYVRPEFDITEALVDMVRQIARARIEGRDGQSVIAALRDALNTADMFTVRDPDMTEALIGVFYKSDRARPAEATQAILQRYIADAQAVGRADMADLLGDGVTPAQALSRAIEAQDARAPMPELQAAREAATGPAGELADLRGLAGDIAPQGAATPSLVKATDGTLRDMAETPQTGPFGPIFRDITDDPEAAIKRIMDAGDGEVPAAFVHPLFDAPIAFVHGRADMAAPSGKRRSGYGLKHIEADHGREFLDGLPDLLRQGTVYRDQGGLTRRYFVDDHTPARVAVVRQDWDGKQKNWIVTSFDDDVGDFIDRSQWEAFRVTGLGEERAPSPTGHIKDGTSAGEDQGQVARQAQTSNEPPASAPSRIPDATGQAENAPRTPANQDVSGGADEIDAAIAQARAEFGDQPDLEIRLGEGTDAAAVRMADVLGDLDRDQNLIQRMTSCRLKGVPR